MDSQPRAGEAERVQGVKEGDVMPIRKLAILLATLSLAAIACTPQRDPNADIARFEKTLALAEAGDAEAATELGMLYNQGLGTEQSEEEAARWHAIAAERGSALGQFNLSVAYGMGIGVERDIAKSVDWVRKAADQGLARAQVNLGTYYEAGIGVPVDFNEAARLFRLAHDQGNTVGTANLGRSYNFGRGVPQDFAKAAELYTIAIKDNVPTALRDLGNLYMQGVGVPHDPRKAFDLNKRAAELGDSGGQLFTASAYLTGDVAPVDEMEALKWLYIVSETGKGEFLAIAKDILASEEPLQSSSKLSDARDKAKAWIAARPEFPDDTVSPYAYAN